jgi:trimeric autotransporter adhesin
MNKSPVIIALQILLICHASRAAELTQDSIISTFAGAAHTFSGDGKSALNAALSGFQQLQTDNNGNVIFADTNNHVVSRLNADGTLTVLAGNGIAGFSGEGGPARSASLKYPSDAVMDKAGNLYIYDSLNLRIRRVTPDGIISTYAGTGVNGYTGDGGPAIQAQIEIGGKMAVDATGTLYFTDGFDAVVRRITPDGTITTYAGNGEPATMANNGNNGPATKAELGLFAGGLAVDSAGNVYIAEDVTNQIRKITPDDTLIPVAGSGTAGFMNGAAMSAQFNAPYGLTVDTGGNLYVADVNNGVVRKMSPAGIVSTVAGTPVFNFSGDGGPALLATFRFPEGCTIGGDGNLYIEDTGNFRIRVVSADGNIHTVAGNGQFESTPDGTPAANSSLVAPNLLSFDPSGRLLIADSGDYTVRRINSDGTVQTIAGTGVEGVGDGYVLTYGQQGNQTLIGTARQAVADAQGNIYVSDDYAGVVYKITPNGILNVFAGQVYVYGSGSDNIQATNSSFITPQGLALDQNGNLYISDPDDNRIRKVSTNGIITTFAGTGTAGFSGDGGPATQATLNFPQGIAFDSKGDLIIADRVNNRLRMVSPDGNISTIAGDGTPGSTGNGGPATAAGLNQPDVVATDSAGDIFLIETGGTTVRRINQDGIITAVAGNGQTGFGGDGGPAIQATLGDADGLAVDSTGNLYIADFDNNRVRVVLTATPRLSATPTALSFMADSGGVTAGPQAINVTSSLAGLQVTASSDSPWLIVPSTIAYAPGSISISADPTGLAPGTYQGNVSLTSPGLTSVLSTVHVTFLVNSPVDPQLTTDVSQLTFSLTSGGGPQSQSLHVLNTGSGQVDFLVVLTGAGSAGLTPSIQQGTTQPNSPVTVGIAADPSKFPIGTTSASLLILGTNFQFATIPITITVSPSPQKMALSQGGFTFVAVAGGGVTPPQSFEVLATGTGGFGWTAQASTVSGGLWLSVSPDSGSSSSTSFGTVTVTANPAGLAPGVYYGLVVVSSAGTVNSPQQFEVVLNVLASQQSAGATAAPSGLIFTAPAGGDSPSSQTFLLTNLNASSAALAVKVTTTDGGAWLVAAPDNGTIAAGASQIITVQPNTGSLPAGVYQAAIAVQVGSMPLTVNVVFVVVPSVTSDSDTSSTAHAVTTASCTATKLYPVFTSLTQGFVIPASWPLPIQLQVVDDCGNPMITGQVAADFSNGDPRLSLASLQTGRWQGIWLGHNLKPSQIVITANADVASPALHGSTTFTGMLASNPNVPSVASGGVTSGAGLTGEVVVAPGDVITIAGQYFAAAPVSATSLPLTTTLAGTQVLFGGASLPLIYSSSGKILAIVPYNLAANAQYQLLVSQGGAISGPASVTVGTAQPGILQVANTNAPSVAKNIWTLLTAGTPFNPATAGPATALTSGDSLVIYCTGLGAINATLAPGQPAPATPVSTVNTVSVSIGGKNMPVGFAGLVPGYPGIYQITGTVPSDAPAGKNIPITVSVAGQTSAAVQVAVQ